VMPRGAAFTTLSQSEADGHKLFTTWPLECHPADGTFSRGRDPWSRAQYVTEGRWALKGV